MNAQKLRYKMCIEIENFISEKLTEFTRETGLIVYPSLRVAAIPAYINEAEGTALLVDDLNEHLCYQLMFDAEISDLFGECPRYGDITQKDWDRANEDSEKRVRELRNKKNGV